MKAIWKTRLLLLKRQWPGLLFWLLLPSLAAASIMLAVGIVQEDSKVPVGIVIKDHSATAHGLASALKGNSLLRVVETTEEDAKNKLEKHELDSVFIIREGYTDQIKKGNRDQLIASYKSDLSYAYTPVKEMLVSYVQQETGRSKAAYIVKQLSEMYDNGLQWSWNDITSKSKQIQKEADLLGTDFSFMGESGQHPDSIFQANLVMTLWALFAILSSFLMSDWIIKEKHASASLRFSFLRFSMHKYLILNACFYTVLLFLFDLFATGLFYLIFPERLDISFLPALLSFRVMTSAGAFLLALCFRRIFLYYSVSFIITLLLGITGGLSAASEAGGSAGLHPLDEFFSGDIALLWPSVFIILITIWYFRKERSDA